MYISLHKILLKKITSILYIKEKFSLKRKHILISNELNLKINSYLKILLLLIYKENTEVIHYIHTHTHTDTHTNYSLITSAPLNLI